MPETPSRRFPAVSKRIRRWLLLIVLVCVGVPYGCSRLAYEERELLFNIEPGTASWFSGIPEGMTSLDIPVTSAVGINEHLHAWWWPASNKNAPTLLYLHGTRWNLTAQLRRISLLRGMGFSVLAIDYRGFGESPGELPSERSVYEDAQIAWRHVVQLQPDARKRYIYGHSLGGAVAVDLAWRIAREHDSKGDPAPAAGLIIESTFTDLADAAAAIANTSLPVRWIMSEKFDSIDKIGHINMPVLIVHGEADRYVPPRFSQALYDAAAQPKQLLLIPGAGHIDSMTLGTKEYSKAIHQTFATQVPPSSRRG